MASPEFGRYLGPTDFQHQLSSPGAIVGARPVVLDIEPPERGDAVNEN